MILSMHQPNLFPWIGYFYKINKSDVFILMDSVQVPRGKSYANRTKILSNKVVSNLVVPISKLNMKEGIIAYNKMLIAEQKQTSKMLRTINMAYKKKPYFEEVYEMIKGIENSKYLGSVNIDFIKNVCDYLEIDTKIEVMSNLFSDEDVLPTKNDLIISFCKWQNCKTYLSGSGASSYNNVELLQENNISLEYTNYNPKIYEQKNDFFIENLSILDLLFRYGKKSKDFLV